MERSGRPDSWAGVCTGLAALVAQMNNTATLSEHHELESKHAPSSRMGTWAAPRHTSLLSSFAAGYVRQDRRGGRMSQLAVRVMQQRRGGRMSQLAVRVMQQR